MHLTHDFSFSHGWWGWLFDGGEALSSGAERSLAVKLRLFIFLLDRPFPALFRLALQHAMQFVFVELIFLAARAQWSASPHPLPFFPPFAFLGQGIASATAFVSRK